MTYVLRHKYPKGTKHAAPSHEFRGAHGYSVQSAIQQSSGGPGPVPGTKDYPINRIDSGDGNDYTLSGTGRPATKTSEVMEAPIAEKISTAANMQGRGFREETPLMGHPGMEAISSDKGLGEPSYQGFRWRGKSNRV